MVGRDVAGRGCSATHDDWPGRPAYDLRWQQLLFEGGYAGVDWPAEGGGRGARRSSS